MDTEYISEEKKQLIVEDRNESGFLRSAFYIITAVFLILPIFFLPSLSVPLFFTKTSLILIGTLVAFSLLIVHLLKEGELLLPFSLVITGIWSVVLAYLVSAVFSASNPLISLIGGRLETDTVFFMAINALLLTIIPILIKSKQRILGVYSGLLIVFVVTFLFQGIRLFFGVDVFSFEIFTNSTSNLIGRWNDLGIFFGLTAILSLITLEGLSLHIISKIVLYSVLAISLFFIGVINFMAVWVVLGIFALSFLIYNILKNKFYFKGSNTKNFSKIKTLGLSVTSLLVLIIAFTFVFVGQPLNIAINSFFSISQIEARPSFQSTMMVARETYKNNLMFGSGPNTFIEQWAKFKPKAVNITPFWNADFRAGVGFIPTSLITTGLFGILAWLFFLAAFLYSGIRNLLLRPISDLFAYYLSLSSFVVAAYLWVFTIIYVPSNVILFLTFFFTGLYLASLRHCEGGLLEKKFIFTENPRLGFVSVLGLTVLLIFTGTGIYLVSKRFVAATYFQRGVVVLNTKGDELEARRMIRMSKGLVETDSSVRFASELETKRLSSIISDTTSSVEDRRTRFKEVLAIAIEDAQKARNLNPNNYRNWFTLGRVYQAVVPLKIEGAYENSKSSYKEALLLSPHQPSLYLALAELEVLNGSTTEARKYINKALSEKSNYTSAVFLLAQIQMNENQIPEAIKSVESAALLEPNNPVIFFQLGLLKYNQGDFAGSVIALERAVEINKEYANARYFLGLSYYNIGRVEESIKQFVFVENTNSDNSEIQSILANLRSGKKPLSGLSAQKKPQDRESLPVVGE